MNVLKLNTSPSFEIIPRKDLDIFETVKIILINEMTQVSQEIICDVFLLENENFEIVLRTFPTGNVYDKFSYKIISITSEVLSLGKLIIVSENENIQNYSKQSNNKYYK